VTSRKTNTQQAQKLDKNTGQTKTNQQNNKTDPPAQARRAGL
jgi:hypothetical protein